LVQQAVLLDRHTWRAEEGAEYRDARIGLVVRSQKGRVVTADTYEFFMGPLRHFYGLCHNIDLLLWKRNQHEA
jgi:hypothetical protein